MIAEGSSGVRRNSKSDDHINREYPWAASCIVCVSGQSGRGDASLSLNSARQGSAQTRIFLNAPTGDWKTSVVAPAVKSVLPGTRSRHRLRWLLFCGFVLVAIAMSRPSLVLAEADTLTRGDISVGIYNYLDPFNRVWYHERDCGGSPCSRFNLLSYHALEQPQIYGEVRTIDTTLVNNTGVRFELGLLDRLTLGGESQFLVSSQGKPKLALGDSKIGARFRVIDGRQIVSFASSIKIPGIYDPASLSAPGAAQPDLDLRVLFGGLAAHRRIFYDLSFGYRLRFPYRNPGEVIVAPILYASDTDTIGQVNTDVAETFIISGPADETFMDLSIGVFSSRKVLWFIYANGVNSTKGLHLEDYYQTLSRQSETDAQDRAAWEVYGSSIDNNSGQGVERLITSLEEDYLRLGAGVMMKVGYSTTLYGLYSYTVLGQNTPAFFVIPNTRIPIGSIALGADFTFGTRKSEAQASRVDPKHALLARTFPQTSFR